MTGYNMYCNEEFSDAQPLHNVMNYVMYKRLCMYVT